MAFTADTNRYTHHQTLVVRCQDLSPLPMKLNGDEAASIRNCQQVGLPSPETNMVGPKSNGGGGVRNRQPPPPMRQDATTASAPPSRSGSTAGSDPGVIEFTKEDVDALLSERMRTKNRFNYKERCELMMDYIRRLRLCIRWFQDVEAGYILEQEHLNEIIMSVENKCNEMEILMQTKEEELNAIIMELRKTTNLLQETCAREESDKLAAMDDLMREQEARKAAEKLQASLSVDLEKVNQEQQSANLKISSLNDMYKRLQEYNTSLQQYNSKLQTELATANETLQRVEREKASIVEDLSTVRGQNSSLQDQLAASKASQDETVKQKEALVSEMGSLKMELYQIKDERDRQWNQVQSLSTEITSYKEFTGQSANALDSLSNKSSELETRCVSQNELIRALQGQLAVAQQKLEMSDLSGVETRLLYEEQGKLVLELQSKLGEAEVKLLEGEKLRKKLHNTILELKGNIRVFCRVRPMLPEEAVSSETKVIGFPTSTEAAGRGVDLLQNGQKNSFIFDRVFMPDAAQQDVFVEISQLVQSALDGYKVCIFAYGQTGSGKTFTMMGNPGNAEQKGLIPRSLEQIFETRQYLQSQGWKYELQVSMLEIYNETIRDLLSKPTSDSARPESSTPGKQHIIKHDAIGNTHVSDLTLVDVRSSKEVAYLLEKAAQSRSVGKTLMNEQSSRSHFVFTLRISGVNESTEQQVQGVLNLIDLAGSERLSKSGSTGDRLKETQAINKSLSSLSDVIFALAKKEDHVPFRNSKLTYLLQPCLGGDSKTLMFVNIAPETSSVSESLCSLRFAARVNACEIGIPRRQTNVRNIESSRTTSS